MSLSGLTLPLTLAAGQSATATLTFAPSAAGAVSGNLAISSDGKWVYASNGTNNAIAVIEFFPGKSRLAGCIPTGWYPAGLVLDVPRKSVYVANVKGIGSRNVDWKGSRKIGDKLVSGYNSHDHLGTVSLIPLPTADLLTKQTQTVLANNRLTDSISALAPPRQNALPRPASTMARIASSSIAQSNASLNSAIIVSSMALRSSGRFSQISATPGASSVSMV